MHVDSVYSFGKRSLPIWVVLKDCISDLFLSNDWKKPRGALKGEGVPSLSWKVDELLSADSSREDALFERFKKLNNGLMNNLDYFVGKDIIFTDPVTLSKMDPAFLFAAAKKLKISAPPTYESDPVKEVFHEPYSNMNAQSDAILFLSSLNPKAYENKIFWPVSFVPFPSVIGDDGRSLSFVFPELIIEINDSLENKLKFGSMRKTLDDLFLPKVGSFECNPATFNQRKLTDLFILHPVEFSKRIEVLREQFAEPELLAREEIAYDVFIKKEMTARLYAKILSHLNINPVYFGAKGSAGKEILDRACELVGKEVVLPGIDGVMPQKTIYSHLDAAALRLLDGKIVGEYARKTRVFPVQVRSEKTDSHDFSLSPCPYAPVWCEEVYDEKQSCARLENKVSTCSRDLFDVMKDDKAMEKLDLGKKWSDFSKNNSEACHLADFVERRAKKMGVRFYSAEHIAWLLSRGPNFEVWTSVDVLDDDVLENDDNRRKKGRASWYSERGSDVIFPFALKDVKKPPFLRASSFNLSCHLGRCLGALKISDVTPDGSAVFGTGAHFLMNGHIDGLLQEKLWEKLGQSPTSRELYAEKNICFEKDGKVIAGHPDCIFGKAPHPLAKELDLIVVDYKTSMATPYLRLGNVLQTATYGLGIVQNQPEFLFKNIYLCIVNTPRVGEKQTINIAKMKNDKNDELYQRVERLQSETLKIMSRLYEEPNFLREFKSEMLSKNACFYDGKHKTGCYENQRVVCERMFKELNDGECLNEYAERVRDNGS